MIENPQHQYLFLTKRPEDIVFSTTLENAWFGITVTSSKEKSHIRTWFRCTTLSTTRETEATSVVWRIKWNGWRKKTAVPSWTTSCPTAGQSLDTRSLWITFTTRKCVARKTAGDATPKNKLWNKWVLTWSCASMSEPFLALFTHSEVFLSLLEGLVLRPLLFDFPRSTIQTERLNNWTVSKLFLQRLQMEEVYMASLILLIVLAVYCIWLLRHMAKRRKEKHGKCVDCPYQGTGMCR